MKKSDTLLGFCQNYRVSIKYCDGEMPHWLVSSGEHVCADTSLFIAVQELRHKVGLDKEIGLRNRQRGDRFKRK